MIDEPENSQQKTERKIPIERVFMKIFLRIRKKLNFESAPISKLGDEMLLSLIQASTSKCVEFNIEANRAKSKTESTFILVSNLRGICEDLIYLTYLSKMGKKSARELVELLIRRSYAEAIVAQRNFFEANAPFQPVLGSKLSKQEAEQFVSESRNDLKNFWRSMNGRTPNKFEMAKEVGLISTYEFIYHSSSNFVHFNPQVLLRMGWGNINSENSVFKFSTRNMSGYYRNFSSFYAAILFLGYEASFGSHYFNTDLDAEIAQVIELISAVHRWPEIVTFEEMNIKPPFFLLLHALGKVVQKNEGKEPYGEIVKEVLSLKHLKDFAS